MATLFEDSALGEVGSEDDSVHSSANEETTSAEEESELDSEEERVAAAEAKRKRRTAKRCVMYCQILGLGNQLMQVAVTC